MPHLRQKVISFLFRARWTVVHSFPFYGPCSSLFKRGTLCEVSLTKQSPLKRCLLFVRIGHSSNRLCGGQLNRVLSIIFIITAFRSVDSVADDVKLRWLFRSFESFIFRKDCSLELTKACSANLWPVGIFRAAHFASHHLLVGHSLSNQMSLCN